MKNKIKTIFIFIGITTFLLTLFFEAFAAPPLKRRHPLRKRPVIKRLFVPAPLVKRPVSPRPGYFWVKRYSLPSGAYVGGYWRPSCGKGFTLVEGHWNDKGEWVFSYCKPVHVKKGYVWIPGHWDGSNWVEGHWRPDKKLGFVWVPGHYNDNGVWIKGHWKAL